MTVRSSGSHAAAAAPLLLITPGYAAPGDAACLPAVRDLVRALSASRSVTVLALRYPQQSQPYPLDGAEIVPLNGGFAAGVARLSLLARACSTATRIARQRGVQVVHALWADEPGFVASVVRQRLGTASVVSLAGGELAALPERGYGVGLQTLGPLLVQVALSNADVVTCGSQWLAALVQAGAPGRVGRTCGRRLSKPPVVAPLGVNLDKFSTAGPRRQLGEGLHVVHVGSAVPVKAHDVLLGAWRDVTARLDTAGLQARLHLVGAGTNQLIDLPAGVVAHGEIAHSQLARLLRACDLWVQSSVYESQSVALLEAAACGLPLVGTAVGLLADCPTACSTVAEQDGGALAVSLLDALTQPELRAKASHATLQWVTTGYGVEATTATFAAVYTSAVTARL